MKHKSSLKLTVGILAMLVISTSCISIPTGSNTETSVVAQRLDQNGKPVETIQQDVVIFHVFYPATPDGPFVSAIGSYKYNYFLVDKIGKRKKLSFLTKNDFYEKYKNIHPISSNRWVAISSIDMNARKHTSQLPFIKDKDNFTVIVFNLEGILFSATVVGCDYEYPYERMIGPQWNSEKEQMLFKTYKGDFIFSASGGSLQKVIK